MLAHDIVRELKNTCNLSLYDIHNLDICNRRNVDTVIAHARPDYVINCAAFTDVDACEQKRDEAFAVNAGGVENLALACKAAGSTLVHISTDFVFDGSRTTPYAADDTPNPLSVYGASKRAGEEHILRIRPSYIILRTSWLYGSAGNNFVSTIRRLSEEKDELRVVDDQRGCPTCSLDLAGAVNALLAVSASGVFHFCNQGVCSWFDFAREIVRILGHDTRVIPVSSKETDRSAVRPAYSALDCSRFRETTGLQPRYWQDALQEFLTC